MTEREKKAVELLRASPITHLWGKLMRNCTDEEVLRAAVGMGFLQAMEWQAELCCEAYTLCDRLSKSHSILNAGTEEAL